MLIIVADIHVHPDKVGLARAELLKLIPPTLAEEGCLQYDLHQDPEDPGHFLFYERWESRELWQAHMDSPHLAEHLEATDGVMVVVLSEMEVVANAKEE